MVTPTSNCVISRPDPKELWERIAGRFSATVLGGGAIIPESNEWYVTSLNYAMAEEFYAYADQLFKETDPRTACCDNLVAMGAQWGLYPKAATFSEGYGELTGTPGAAVPAIMEMQAGGKTYRTTGRMPSALNGQGRAVVRWRALEPGSAGNLSGVEQGRLTVAAAGLNRNVNIFGGQFCGGAEEETCEQFRRRYIERIAFRPRANHDWLMEKLLEWPCVTRVCDRGGACCADDPETGNCDCDCANCATNSGNQFYVIFDDTFPCGAAPQCVLDEISEWLFGPEGRQGKGLGEAPIGVCGSLHEFQIARFSLEIEAVDASITPTQAEAIEAALRDYMSTICPSSTVSYQALSLVVGQVLGLGVQFEIYIDIHNPGRLRTDSCNNLLPICDAMPCLRGVTFAAPVEEPTICP